MPPTLEIADLLSILGVPSVAPLNLHLLLGERLLILQPPANAGRLLAHAILASAPSPPQSAVQFGGVPLSTYRDQELARLVSYVPANPLLALSGMASTVRDELIWSFRLLGVDAGDALSHIERIAAVVGITPLLSRQVHTLSGGELARLVITASLCKAPAIVLLDDAMQHLDAESYGLVQDALRSASTPVPVVLEVASRCPDVTLPARCILIDDGHATPLTLPHDAGLLPRVPEAEQLEDESPASSSNGIRLTTQRLTQRRGAHFHLGPIDLDLRAGVVALVGKNGSGKSSLLRTLALLDYPTSGSLAISGTASGACCPAPPKRVSHRWAAYCRYCPQIMDAYITQRSIRDVISDAARPRRWDSAHESLCDALSLRESLTGSPWDVAPSVRRLAGIAGALLSGAPVVLLDEPTAGLTTAQTMALICVLRDHVTHERIVISASHDVDFLCAVSNAALIVEQGMIRSFTGRTDVRRTICCRGGTIPQSEVVHPSRSLH